MISTRYPKQFKPKPELAIRAVGQENKPYIQLQVSPFVVLVIGVVAIGLAFLAGLSIVNLFTDKPATPYFEHLSNLSNGTTREFELQRLVDRETLRMNDLQKENQERETEVAQLEGTLSALGNTLSFLKTKIDQIPEKGVPAKVPSASGSQNGSKVPEAISNSNFAGSYSTYYVQLQKLETQLSSLNQTVYEKKVGLDNLQQSFDDYNKELAKLTGKNPPLPGAINSVSDANSLMPPDMLPGEGQFTSFFGWRDSPFRPGTREWHDGVDIACNFGAPVRATKAGIVTFSGLNPQGYGLRVDLNHENGWATFYGHNSQLLVRVGQVVNRGDIIGLCGSTGASTGPHIHYGLHFNGTMTDPLRYLSAAAKAR